MAYRKALYKKDIRNEWDISVESKTVLQLIDRNELSGYAIIAHWDPIDCPMQNSVC